jgi:hypothetical protein
VVGEIKKQKYIYYHCTGYADKCRGEPASCRRKYVREEVLEQQFTAMLGQLRFDDEFLEWVREALHASHADERHEHEEAVKRLQAEHRRLGERISAMYIALDRRCGRVFASRSRRTTRRARRVDRTRPPSHFDFSTVRLRNGNCGRTLSALREAGAWLRMNVSYVR